MSAYLDGELSPSRAGQIQQALANDPELAAELEELRAVGNLLAALPHERAPRDLAESILQQAERASLIDAPATQAHARPLRWMRYTAAAAMLVMATALGAMMVSSLWPTDIPSEPFAPLARSGDNDADRGSGESGKPTGAGINEDLLKGRSTIGDIAGKGRTDVGDAGGTVLVHKATRGTGLGGTGGTDGSSARHSKDGFDGGIVRLGSLPDAEINEVIYTPAISHTQRRIETFLVSNSIKPVVTTPPTKVANDPSPPRIAARGNYYQADRIMDEQVSIRIEAATLEQIEQIRAEIRRIRGEQRVSQVTIPGETLAALGHPRRTGGYVGKGGPRPAKPAPKPALRPATTASGDRPEDGETLAEDVPARTRGGDKYKNKTGPAEGEMVDSGTAKPTTDPGKVGGEIRPGGQSDKSNETTPGEPKESGPGLKGKGADTGSDQRGQKKRPDLPPGTAIARAETDQVQVAGDIGNGASAGRNPKRLLDRGTTSDGKTNDPKSDDGHKSATGAGQVRGDEGGGKHGPASQPSGGATTQAASTTGKARTQIRGRCGPDRQDLSQIAGANVRTLIITLNFRSMIPYPPTIQLDATLRKEDVAPVNPSKK